jgi:hypothetical protein
MATHTKIVESLRLCFDKTVTPEHHRPRPAEWKYFVVKNELKGFFRFVSPGPPRKTSDPEEARGKSIYHKPSNGANAKSLRSKEAVGHSAETFWPRPALSPVGPQRRPSMLGLAGSFPSILDNLGTRA